MIMNPMWIGSALILLSAAGFGLMPIFALFAYDSGLNVSTLLFIRFTITALAFFAWLAATKSPFRITREQCLMLFLLGGVGYALQSTLYFSAVRYISPSLTALLLYLFPVFVAVLSFLVNKERMTGVEIVSLAVSLGGIVLVLGFPDGEINFIGVLLAVGAAVVYSFYIILGNRVTREVSPAATSAWIALFAACTFGIWGGTTGRLSFDFAPFGWLMVGGIALFCTVMSMFSFFAGMKRTGPTQASILSMFEPVTTILFSALILNEQLTPLQLLGGLVVLGGAVAAVLAKSRREAQPVSATAATVSSGSPGIQTENGSSA